MNGKYNGFKNWFNTIIELNITKEKKAVLLNTLSRRD